MHEHDDDLGDIRWLRAYLGGKDRPVNQSTVYRNIRAGNIPAPIHPVPGISRWVKSQVRAARARQLAERDWGAE